MAETRPRKKSRKGYPHFKVKEVTHAHPRAIVETTEIQTENGTLMITRSMDSQVKTNVIPKKTNLDIERITTPPFTLKRYKGQKIVLVSDRNGKWLGKLEKHDLKNLFFQIGEMLGRIKNETNDLATALQNVCKMSEKKKPKTSLISDKDEK